MNISDNPFFRLEVSTRADRRQIAEAAEDKAFRNEGDSEAITAARTALVIPDQRLCAEVRWFPGMEDARVREIVSFFRRITAGQPPVGINTSGFRSLTLLNFAVYMFSYRKFRDVADMSKSLLLICENFEALNAEWICTVLNNDRKIAGFPMIERRELERELNDYRRDILRIIDGRVSRLSQEKYMELTEVLADNYADNGSLLLDDLMSSYELNILPQLEEQIRKIADSVSRAGAEVSEKFFAELPRYIREWRKLADPLLKVSRAVGMENSNIHAQGREIFDTVQQKAITLNNEHNRTGDALRLILMMKDYIAPVSESLSATIDRDITELQKIKYNQEQAERRAKREREAWERSIYYETEFGLLFKDKLIISAEGISWKGVLTPLEEVSGISWGGVRQYTNGLHTGTTYNITIYASFSRIYLTPNDKKYSEIIEHLWRALGWSLSTKILTQLKNGEMLCFGSIKLKDNGVYLKKSGWFSSEVKFFTWADRFRIDSNNGFLFIAKDEYFAISSYMDDMNTHILESILTHFLSKPREPGARLSSLLD